MNPETTKGELIVFEGGDETGKTTHARWVAEQRNALYTCEPSEGIKLREILLGIGDMQLDARTEALLFAADRAHHVAHVIRPELERGVDVICDRYIASSLAYQSYGRGLDFDEVFELSEFASGRLFPDLTVLLHISYETYLERLAGSSETFTRFDAETEEFHQRMIAGFVEMAQANADSWVIIDASPPLAEVKQAIASVLADRLGWQL